jgi:hypothetical protein
MNTAWITSFSNDLYEATGKELIRSYEDTASCGKLFIAPERVNNLVRIKPEATVLLSDPADSPDLFTWVSKNKSIIHKEFGGTWTGPCKCPNPHDSKDKRHKASCPNSWFCKHAVRWFRKIIALKSLLATSYQYDRVVWLDSDVVFKQKVTEELVTSWFNGNDVFYFKGPKRKVWETGIFGLSVPNGLTLVNKVFDCYMSGEFLKHPRWDDGYIIQQVASADKAMKKLDLATDASGHADVIPHSPLKDYMEHHKGTHGRGLGIMK